jgi:hypothetical protein
MHPVCDDKARSYEAVLQNLTNTHIKLALATAAKDHPSKSEVKGILRSAAEDLGDTSFSNLKLRGYWNSILDLVDGIDKGDISVTGDLLLRHFEDIEGNIWDQAW